MFFRSRTCHMVQTHLVELGGLAPCLSLGCRQASGSHMGSLQGKLSCPSGPRPHMISTVGSDRARVRAELALPSPQSASRSEFPSPPPTMASAHSSFRESAQPVGCALLWRSQEMLLGKNGEFPGGMADGKGNTSREGGVGDTAAQPVHSSPAKDVGISSRLTRCRFGPRGYSRDQGR